MLQPKRTKFRKAHKGRIHGDAKGGTSLNFGAYGLKAMEPERITARQIEAARRAITRHIKRAGRRPRPARQDRFRAGGGEASDQDQGGRPPWRIRARGRIRWRRSTI